MKRILILQDGGYHEKNKHLRECLILQKGFINNGHHCDVWGKNHPECNIEILPDFDSYDLIIDLWELYHSRLDLSVTETKKFLWSCDAHVNGEEKYKKVMELGNYDLILKTTKNLFKNTPSFWLKPWIDLESIKKKNIEKTNFIGFCGMRNPQRNEYIDRLTNIFDMKQDIFVIGDDMVNAINSYQIHFNKNLGYPHGFSYRIAETFACGTLLLTNSSYMYDDIGIEDRKNCLIYDTFEDIIEQLEWVKHGNRIQTLAENGYKLRTKFSPESAAHSLEELI